MDGIANTIEELPLEQLEHQITQHAANIYAGTCRWLELVAEFDRRRGWASWGCRSASHWLSWRCSIAPSAAREQVRVARLLAELPLIREAFSRGELSYSKARALTRVATPAIEESLVDLARHSTASQLERVVRAYRSVAGADVDAAQLAHARRFVSWEWEEDGSLSIRGRLSAEDGAAFITAIQAAALVDAPLEFGARGASAEAEAGAGGPAAGSAATTEREGVSAEAPVLAALRDPVVAEHRLRAVGGAEDEDAAMRAEQPIDCGRGARAADALVRLVEAGGPGAARAGLARSTEVVVHVDVESLQGEVIHHRSEIDDGPAIPPETARRMTCDGAVVLMAERDGVPLDVGRRTRAIPPAMRRALDSRDGGCRFPGCGHRHGVQAHHLVHWARGGRTDRDNLVLLCRFHHRLVHEGGFTAMRSDGDVVFLRPDGRRIAPVPVPATGRATAIEDANRGSGLRIDSRTSVPRWFGERLDLHYVVAGLCEREARAA